MTMLTLVISIAVFVCVLVLVLVAILMYWDAKEAKQTAEERTRRQEFYRIIYTGDVITNEATDASSPRQSV